MSKTIPFLLLLILLVIGLGAVVNAHALSAQSGIDPDVSTSFSIDTNFIFSFITAACVSLVMRTAHTVLLDKKNFFLFAWRNSYYGRRRFVTLSLLV